MIHFKKKEVNQGGTKYFQNSRNTEVKELQDGLSSLKLEKQKDAMKQIIASMTIGKDVSMLFPDVVKCIRTKNIELKKLVYLYLINYAKIKPDLIFLAVASFNTDAKEGATPLIRGLAIRTMGYIRVPEIVSYLCETLSFCFKDKDAYVRKIAALCVAKLYMTSPQLVHENGFINTLHDCLKDSNPVVVANAMNALNEMSVLSGKNMLQLKSKGLKHIFESIQHSNEWGQVSILDALILYNPKKSSHAEEVIEGVLPRLNHTNPAVVMSAIKVILKFMDQIDNIDKVRNYCKKISNSLMSLMMASPEIQYVLLRALHGIVQKRPMLLDKDFKFFFVQYNDPIYVKLEKVDILYKLCDNKNYESIIKEFTSYALTEINGEVIRKSVKYIGQIGYKFEKSVDFCVDSIAKIIEKNNDEAINESIIVARDLMRKYKGHSLELLKKINIDLINSLTDPNAKSAAFYIVGDFCTMIPNSTKIITHFVENFSNADIISKIKLQILNATVKNFVNKPDEGEDIVKICLQKGAEESENPDVRDRAYIYWRLLEVDPDLAKDMMVSEKPPFEFVDEDDLDGETVDDITSNMTNLSAVYLKKQAEIILEEDMIADVGGEEINKEEEEEPKEKEKEKEKDKKKKKKNEEKEEKEEKDKGEKDKEEKEKEKKKKKKKEKKKAKEEEQMANNEADLIGLGEDQEAGGESVHQSNKNVTSQAQAQNIPQNQPPKGSVDDIFSVFNMMGNSNNNNNNINTINNNPMPSNNDPFGAFNFGGASTAQQPTQAQVPQTIFQNAGQVPTSGVSLCCSQNGASIYSQFQRSNGLLSLGLFLSIPNSPSLNGMCSLVIGKNSFGLTSQQSTAVSNNSAFFMITNSNNNTNMQAPPSPFVVDAVLGINGQEFNLKLKICIRFLFIENFKLVGNPFVTFFKENKDQQFNTQVYVYNNQNNEDVVKGLFEKNNILLSARQNKANPPSSFYCANILGSMNLLIQSYLNNGVINIKLIANTPCVIPLVKEAIDEILA